MSDLKLASIGHEEIDRQHGELFRAIRRLQHVLQQDEGYDEVESLLLFLRHYVEDHFTLEEHYMKAYSFPQSLKHHQDHTRFVKVIHSLESRSIDTPERAHVADEALRILYRWLQQHIARMDTALGAYLKAFMDDMTSHHP